MRRDSPTLRLAVRHSLPGKHFSHSWEELFMNKSERSVTPMAEISIAELEARFEMEAVPIPADAQPSADWSCACAYLF
jgi:hypothetical protein